MANSAVVLTQDQRSEAIRNFASQLITLNTEKNRTIDKIRSLSRQVKNDLGMSSKDFGLAMRMYGAAIRNKEQTIATIKEVMLALGDATTIVSIEPPAPAPQPKKLPFGKATLGDKVLKFVMAQGPVISRAVAEQYGASGVAYLSHLKRWGYLKNDGGLWKTTGQ